MKKFILAAAFGFAALNFSAGEAAIPYDNIVVENVTIDVGMDEGLSFAGRLEKENSKGDLLIVTHNLPRIKAYAKTLSGRKFTMVCNEKYTREAQWLKDLYPEAKIYTMDMVNAKVLLIAPDIAWVGSPNFGSYGYVESGIGMKNKTVYDYYYKKINEMIAKSCKELKAKKKKTQDKNAKKS